MNDNYVISKFFIINHTCSQWLWPYYSPSSVQPENVEPGRVLGLRPGQAASRLGRVLGRAHGAQPYESWRMKVSKGKVPYRYNPFTLRVTFVISEA